MSVCVLSEVCVVMGVDGPNSISTCVPSSNWRTMWSSHSKSKSKSFQVSFCARLILSFPTIPPLEDNIFVCLFALGTLWTVSKKQEIIKYNSLLRQQAIIIIVNAFGWFTFATQKHAYVSSTFILIGLLSFHVFDSVPSHSSSKIFNNIVPTQL